MANRKQKSNATKGNQGDRPARFTELERDVRDRPGSGRREAKRGEVSN